MMIIIMVICSQLFVILLASTIAYVKKIVQHTCALTVVLFFCRQTIRFGQPPSGCSQ